MNASFLLIITRVKNPHRHASNISHFHNNCNQIFSPISLVFFSLFLSTQYWHLPIHFLDANQRLSNEFYQNSIFYRHFIFFHLSMSQEIVNIFVLSYTWYFLIVRKRKTSPHLTREVEVFLDHCRVRLVQFLLTITSCSLLIIMNSCKIYHLRSPIILPFSRPELMENLEKLELWLTSSYYLSYALLFEDDSSAASFELLSFIFFIRFLFSLYDSHSCLLSLFFDFY